MNLFQSIFRLLQHGRSTQPITRASLDDEVFAYRERAYGSYELRKNQPWYLMTAMGLVLSTVLALVFVPIWLKGEMPLEMGKEKSRILCACCFDCIDPPEPLFIQIPQGQMISCNLLPKHEYDLSHFYEQETNHFPKKLKRAPKKIVEFKIPKPAAQEELDLDLIYLREVDRQHKTLIPTGAEKGNIWQDCVDCLEEQETLLQLPEITEFVYADAEPVPLNLEEIRKEIRFPAGLPSGKVIFRVLVDAEGNTKDFQAIGQAPMPFVEAIASHLEELKWTPAMQEGKAIAFWVNVPFVFKGF